MSDAGAELPPPDRSFVAGAGLEIPPVEGQSVARSGSGFQFAGELAGASVIVALGLAIGEIAASVHEPVAFHAFGVAKEQGRGRIFSLRP